MCVIKSNRSISKTSILRSLFGPFRTQSTCSIAPTTDSGYTWSAKFHNISTCNRLSRSAPHHVIMFDSFDSRMLDNQHIWHRGMLKTLERVSSATSSIQNTRHSTHSHTSLSQLFLACFLSFLPFLIDYVQCQV
jgi:hypothetical protein